MKTKIHFRRLKSAFVWQGLIAKALTRMRQNYAENLTVEKLADDVGMSVSVFHRSFKKVTGSSPSQYLKKVRLNKASSLIIHDGLRASVAASQAADTSNSMGAYARAYKILF